LSQHLNAGADLDVLDRALYFAAYFAAAEPLLQSCAAGVNVLVHISIDEASAVERVLHADAVFAAVFGSVLGFFAGGIIAPAVVEARISTCHLGNGIVMNGDDGCRRVLGHADAGVMRVRVDDAAVQDLEGETRWQDEAGGAYKSLCKNQNAEQKKLHRAVDARGEGQRFACRGRGQLSEENVENVEVKACRISCCKYEK
jgi:hypothetical protein